MTPVQDVNRLIAKDLSVRDLMCLSQVSKEYREMVNDDFIWKPIVTREYPHCNPSCETRHSFMSRYAMYKRCTYTEIISKNRSDLLADKYSGIFPTKEDVLLAERKRAGDVLRYWIEKYSNRQQYSIRTAHLFLEVHDWKTLYLLARMGLDLPRRLKYPKAYLINRALRSRDYESVKRCLSEGCCPDENSVDLALLLGNDEVISVASKRWILPTKDAIRKAIVARGPSVLGSLCKYFDKGPVAVQTLNQVARHCYETLKAILELHTFNRLDLRNAYYLATTDESRTILHKYIIW